MPGCLPWWHFVSFRKTSLESFAIEVPNRFPPLPEVAAAPTVILFSTVPGILTAGAAAEVKTKTITARGCTGN